MPNLVTNADSMDVESYVSMKDRSGLVRQLEAGNKSAAMADLLLDGYSSFIKYAPEIKPDIPAERKLNARVISEIMQLKEFEQLRNYTKGDKENSIGALGAVKQCWTNLPEEVKEEQEKAEQIAQQLDAALNGDGDPADVPDLFKQLEKAEQALNTQIEEYADDIRGAVRRACAEAEGDAADSELGMAALGWGRSGSSIEAGSADDKLRVASALKHNPQLKEIIRLAGRMTNIAQKKQRQKINYFRTEITGIEQGDDLTSVVPSEFAYFVSKRKSLHTLFLKRLSQQELVQYEMSSKEPKAQGPVIVEIDCSSSMTGAPDTWSKACALALYSIARKQKRDFVMVLFNTVCIREITILKGEHKAEDLMSMLSAGTGGGTSFEAPLTRAIELLEVTEFKKADVIFITDGDCCCSAEYLKKYNTVRKEKEVNVYTIMIGGCETMKKDAEKFSDSVTMLLDQLDENEGAAFSAVFNI